MWIAKSCFAAILLFGGGSAFAQVIFSPLCYQYGRGANTFYYGGSDPEVIQFAQGPAEGCWWGRVNGAAFIGGTSDRHREVTHAAPRIFTDALPFEDASIYGYTIADAANAAYAAQPRYFRKCDLLPVLPSERPGNSERPAYPPHPATIGTAQVLIVPGGGPLPLAKSNNIIIHRN